MRPTSARPRDSPRSGRGAAAPNGYRSRGAGGAAIRHVRHPTSRTCRDGRGCGHPPDRGVQRPHRRPTGAGACRGRRPRRRFAACVPAPLAARAAAVLVAGLPETLTPKDPLDDVTPPARGRRHPVDPAPSDVHRRRWQPSRRGCRDQKPADHCYVAADEAGDEVSTFRPLFGRTESAYAVGGQGDTEAPEGAGYVRSAASSTTSA